LSDIYEMHVIPNTHWDREWLYDFQETRMQLVSFLDKLLAMLDSNPGYKSFLMDSQVAPIEDYLDVRPENRGRIEEHVKTGRLLIGPWYTCPEEFNVNGESLVRNLLMGHRVAGSLGHVMKIGYSPFSYGQNSQIAQIYAGFGIDTILFYHGVTLEEVPSEFILEGADGTRLLGTRMGSNARYNFFFDVYRPAVYGKEILERDYAWKDGGLPFHLCGPRDYLGHYFLLDPAKRLDEEKLKSGLENLKAKEVEACSTKVLAYMLGHDSYEPDPVEIDLVQRAASTVRPDRLFFSTLEDYIRRLKSEAKDLPVLKGERRTPRMIGRAAFLYHEVTSSRTRVKQANSRAEAELQRWAEPFSSVAHAIGYEYPRALLETAWKYLFRCHPHDTIAGTGVDQIERDVTYRLDQVINISRGLTRRALQNIQLKVDNSDLPEDEVAVTVYNPSPFERTEVVTAYLDLPKECGYEYFSILDGETAEKVESQVFSIAEDHPVMRNMNDATLEMPSEKVGLHFLAPRVPGLGYRTFRIVHEDHASMSVGSMITSPRKMENEYVSVEVMGNGTLTVTDKASGRTYSGLNLFVDDGEAGHAWRHIPPAHDRVITSEGSPATVSVAEDGPLVSSFRVDVTMKIPLELDEAGSDEIKRLDGNGDKARRSEEEREMKVSSLITLRKGQRYVEIVTAFDNQCRDHRFRAAFPTALDTDVCHAESAFDVVERRIVRDSKGPWISPWNPASPQQRFVDLSDGEAGLAVINDGLREYEISEDPSRTIYLTLLRAYEVALTTVAWRWERHPEMKLSQCPGEHEFRYAVMPHAGEWSKAGVGPQAERFNLPMTVAQVGRHGGSMPKAWGFVTIEPENVLMSALKRAEEDDSLVLRLYNPTPSSIEAKVHLSMPLRSAELTDFEERRKESLSIEGQGLSITVEPKKVLTIRLEGER